MTKDEMTKDRPLVTVGIPFYNAEQTLADAIRSVFAQTLIDWELILMDDGSTDGSLDVARSIEDPRVRVVCDGRHLALAARLNQITGLARGKFIARLDADDLMHPDRLQAQVSYLHANPAVDVVGTGMYILDGSGQPIACRRDREAPAARQLFVKGPLSHATVTGRRAWFLAYQYDESYTSTQDRELWCRAFATSRFANLVECYYFCSEISSFSLSKAARACLAEARMCAKHGPEYVGLPLAGLLVLAAILKIPAHACITALGLQPRVIRRRSQPLSREERVRAEEALSSVRSTALPLTSEPCHRTQPPLQPSPLLTVGISFYNAEQTLADAIRSVFAQTLTDWELILVDDGSTDGSLEIASSVADSRVRVVSDGKNLGLSARLNQIALLARGEYLARMDSDDLMHPDRLEAQLDFLKRQPEVDVVGSGMLILDEDGCPVAKRLPQTRIDAQYVLLKGAFAHATIVGRLGWFQRNPYDSAFDGCEDRELWLRSFARSHFANLPECFYFCTEHSSFSLKKCIARGRTNARCYRKHGSAFVGRGTAFVLASREELKTAVYAAAVTLGLEQRLINRRSVKLTMQEQSVAAEVLARIRATQIPLRSATEDEALVGTGSPDKL
jgi:glycosyltransferase involved in cell wall biosynthesis